LQLPGVEGIIRKSPVSTLPIWLIGDLYIRLNMDATILFFEVDEGWFAGERDGDIRFPSSRHPLVLELRIFRHLLTIDVVA
jgi:hypothetical protein